MEPFWIPKKDNILTTFLIINLPHFSLSVKWAENELEMRHKNDNILTTFWQHFDNIFRTFWKWQRFDNILTTFWQHFLKKYLRENELILSCKWAVNYPIGDILELQWDVLLYRHAEFRRKIKDLYSLTGKFRTTHR